MKLAIVADWLTTFGGAEHVIAELLELYPNTPIFTTVTHRKALGPLKDADIRTSWLQKWYALLGKHQPLLPWMPRAIEDIDLRGFDVVISSSHAVAKGVIVESSAVHICYCHTPVRYGWEMEDDYIRDFGIPGWLEPFVRKELKRIRRWDNTTAKRVDVFLANSATTQERIQRIYNRSSTIVPPPVADRFFAAEQTVGDEEFFFAAGRFVPYKRFDLLIETANKLQLPLWIAGKGQDEKRLKALAGPTVRFLGRVSDDELMKLYVEATAFLFPQVEDAGIVLREALACGTPCIAYGKGGALDAVIDGKTGVLFDEQTVDGLEQALKRFATYSWNAQDIREHARMFALEKFTTAIQTVVEHAANKDAAARIV